MIIDKTNQAYRFEVGDGSQVVYPAQAILFITNDNSDSVNVRLKASRKNVLTFNYKDVTNYSATSAADLVKQLL